MLQISKFSGTVGRVRREAAAAEPDSSSLLWARPRKLCSTCTEEEGRPAGRGFMERLQEWKKKLEENKEGKPLRGENKKFLPLLLVFQLKSQSTNDINLDLKL